MEICCWTLLIYADDCFLLFSSGNIGIWFLKNVMYLELQKMYLQIGF